jgi:HSP20 family protein
MNMIRYQPWSVMNRLHRDLDELFSSRFPSESEEPATVSDWVPAVDINEDDSQFTLWADLPGVSSDDVQVTMENGTLSIQGKREHETSEQGNGYRRVERTRGRFLRRFSLPDTADESGITARSADGVLEIVIPKQPHQLAKTIKVKAA